MPAQKPHFVPDLVLTSTGTAITFNFRPADHDRRHHGFGWAIATVNNASGEVNIQSDWGNWAYRWHVDPRNLAAPTLVHFLAKYDRYSDGEHGQYHCDYLARKLCGRDEANAFDPDATVKYIQRELCKQRLEQGRAAIENARDMFYDDETGQWDPPAGFTDPVDAALCRYGEKRRHGATYAYTETKEPLSKGIARELFDALDGELRDTMDSNLFCERYFKIVESEWVTNEPWECLQHEPTTGFQVLLFGILPALVKACHAHLRGSFARKDEPEWSPYGHSGEWLS